MPGLAPGAVTPCRRKRITWFFPADYQGWRNARRRLPQYQLLTTASDGASPQNRSYRDSVPIKPTSTIPVVRHGSLEAGVNRVESNGLPAGYLRKVATVSLSGLRCSCSRCVSTHLPNCPVSSDLTALL